MLTLFEASGPALGAIIAYLWMPGVTVLPALVGFIIGICLCLLVKNIINL